MYDQVSTCPNCGAPIYVECIQHSILPPSPIYTCNCVERPKYEWATSDSYYVNNSTAKCVGV